MSITYTKDQLDDRILTILKGNVGETHAIHRWKLVEIVFGPEAVQDQSDDNVWDRQIRRAKERLRKKGLLICDLANGDGSFLAANVEEYLQFRSIYGSHAFPIMDTIRAMDKAAERQFPNGLQPRLL